MWQWIFSEIPRWSNDVNILLSISYYCPLDADFPHHCIPAPLIPRKMNEGEFFHYKSNVIANMAINDNSPKGSLDRPVQDLVYTINEHPNYVSTSSCSGRILLYLNQNSSKGVRWVFVSHQPVSTSSIESCVFQLSTVNQGDLFMKCEGFLLHVQCKDIDSANDLLQVATLSGYRESGITSSAKSQKIIVAIRSYAFNVDLPILLSGTMVIQPSSLEKIVRLMNEQLRKNFQKMERLLQSFKLKFQYPTLSVQKNVRILFSKAVQRFPHDSWLEYALYEIRVGGRMSFTERVLPNYQLLEVFCKRTMCPIALQHIGDVPDIHEQRWGHIFLDISARPDAVYYDGGMKREENDADNVHFLLLGGRTTDSVVSNHYFIEWQQHNHLWKWTSLSDNVPATLLSRFYHAACVLRASVARETAVFITGGLAHIDESPARESLCESFILQPHLSPMRISYCRQHDHMLRFGHSMQSLIGKSVLIIGGVDCAPFASSSTNATAVVIDYTIEDGEVVLFTQEPHREILPMTLVHFHAQYQYDAEHFPTKNILNLIPQPIPCFGFGPYNPSPVTLHIGFEGVTKPFQTSHLLHDSSFPKADGKWVEAILTTKSMTKRVKNLLEKYHLFNKKLKIFTCPLPPIAQSIQSFDQALQQKQAMAFPLSTDSSCAGDLMALPLIPSTMQTLLEDLSHPERIACFSTELSRLCASNASKDACFLGLVKQHAKPEGKKVMKAYAPSPPIIPEAIIRYPILLVTTQETKKSKRKLESLGLFNKQKKIMPVSNVTGISAFVASDTNQLWDMLAAQFEGVCALTKTWEILPDAKLTNDLMCIPLTLDAFSARYKNDWEQICFTEQLSTIWIGYVTNLGIESNAWFTNKKRRTEQLLKEWYDKQNIAVDEKLRTKFFPSKFEIVGDVLMLPNDSYLVEFHDAVTTDNEYRTSAMKLFGELATVHGCSRVARKAEIDSGPRRESRVRLLFVNRAVTAALPSEGWVTVVENRIPFSFDITKVMFCSGNCTERMRMGTPHFCDGEIVYDLFCGIGYYTLPMLVHGGAKHVYAFEWNPNSVIALKHNLRVSGVSERCTVHEGDNRLTLPQVIGSIPPANRVMLGLLPSSRQSWETSVSLIQLSGGMIHIHENVHERELYPQDGSPSWQQQTCALFREWYHVRVQRETGITDAVVHVNIVHLETVKSYAPRVFHVVLDLKLAFSM